MLELSADLRLLDEPADDLRVPDVLVAQHLERHVAAEVDVPGAVHDADTDTSADDPWDAELDAAVAREVLAELGAHHRAALTLRYLDGLSVPEVARELDRTVHATEALLVRARRAFRSAYEERGNDG